MKENNHKGIFNIFILAILGVALVGGILFIYTHYKQTKLVENKITAEPSISVLSPNGGEEWYRGQTKEIKISVHIPSIDEVPHLNYSIKPYKLNDTSRCAVGTCDMLSADTPANPISWQVGTVLDNDTYKSIPDGQYVIEVCTVGKNSICDTSDKLFIIKSKVSSPINFIYPKGGEILTAGLPAIIKWDFSAPISSDKQYFSLSDGHGTVLASMITPSEAGCKPNGTGCTYTWTPKGPATQYQFILSQGSSGAVGKSGIFSIKNK